MSEWQPINTAPKNGSWILAYRAPPEVGGWETLVPVRWLDNGEVRDFIWPDDWSGPTDPFTASADDDDWIAGGDFYESGGSFTHWMPLPQPPVS